MSAPVVRITVDGKLALTVEQAAVKYELEASSMRGELTRLKAAGKLEPAAYLDGRKPLYLASALGAAMRHRPGRGAPGRARPSNCDECGHRKAGHAPVLISAEPQVYGLGRCSVKGCRCGAGAG